MLIHISILLLYLLPSTLSASSAHAQLTLHLPPNLPALHPSTRALLTTTGSTKTAPLTRTNTFVFSNLSSSFDDGAVWNLDIGCRDYDFAPMTVHLGESGIEVVRRGGGGEVKKFDRGGWEVRVLKGREGWEERAGFSPMGLLKNPMILLGVVGFAFVIGMPYLLDNMDPETKAEFEEHQKKSVLNSNVAAGGNPLQNFDIAAWMAGKTSAAVGGSSSGSGGSGGGGGGGGGKKTGGKEGEGNKMRRRG